MNGSKDTNPLTGIQYHKAQVEGIAQAIRDERAALRRADGLPLYGDQEMAEREAAIRDTYAARLSEAKAQIAHYMEVGRAQMRQQSADQSADLSAEQLQRASAMAPFVQEDIRDLPDDQLFDRLESIAENGDTVSRWLYGRYAGRVAEEMQQIDGPDLSLRVRKLREAAKTLTELAQDPRRVEMVKTARQAQETGSAALREVNRALTELGGGLKPLVDIRGIF